MLEYDVLLANGLISIVSALIGGYVLSKIIMRKAENSVLSMIEEKKEEAKEWLRSEDGSKFVYSVGALLAAGFKGGLGMQKSSGKSGLTGLLMEIAGSWLKSKIGVSESNQPQEQGVRAGLG